MSELPLPLHQRIEEIEAAIRKAQDITPEQSTTRVCIYRDVCFLTHKYCTVLLCATCGKIRDGLVHLATDLTLSQQYELAESIQQNCLCLCWKQEERTEEKKL